MRDGFITEWKDSSGRVLTETVWNDQNWGMDTAGDMWGADDTTWTPDMNWDNDQHWNDAGEHDNGAEPFQCPYANYSSEDEWAE